MNKLVNIELDKTRHIYFGFKAQGITEKMLGIKSFLKYDGENMSISDIGIILYAGLVWEDSDLTLEKVIDLVDQHSDTVTIINATSQAIQNAMSNGKEEENTEKNV